MWYNPHCHERIPGTSEQLHTRSTALGHRSLNFGSSADGRQTGTPVRAPADARGPFACRDRAVAPPAGSAERLRDGRSCKSLYCRSNSFRVNRTLPTKDRQPRRFLGGAVDGPGLRAWVLARGGSIRQYLTCSVGEERGVLSKTPRFFVARYQSKGCREHSSTGRTSVCQAGDGGSNPSVRSYRHPGGSGPRGRGSPAVSPVQRRRRERCGVTSMAGRWQEADSG